MLKKFLVTFVFLCIVYLVGGYVAATKGFIEQETYAFSASVAGGAASLIGLLALARPAINKDDIAAIEIESIKKVHRLSEQVESAKRERAETEEEIARLAAQREEMEFLVRKASLALFLQERLAKANRRIVEIVGHNRELEELLADYMETTTKLRELDEEITSDENVEILHEVIRAAGPLQREGRTDDPYLLLFRAASAVAKNLLGSTVRVRF